MHLHRDSSPPPAARNHRHPLCGPPGLAHPVPGWPRTVRRVWLATLLAAAAILLEPRAAGQEAAAFKVLVNLSNPVEQLSREHLSKIFLKQIDRWEAGLRVAPVNQPVDSRVRDVFSRYVHHRSGSRINAFWQQQIYSGGGVPPPERTGDPEVLEFVRSHRGGIGYVSPAADTRGTKVVSISGN